MRHYLLLRIAQRRLARRAPARPATGRPASAGLPSTLLALAAVAAFAGCASTPGTADPQLQGHWRVDSAASDDATARITNAIGSAQKREAARRRRAATEFSARPGGSSEGGAGEAGTGDDDEAANNFDLGARIGPNFQQLRQRLLQTLASPTTLTFTVLSDDVQIERDGLPGREYQPGDTITRFEEYGTAQLRSAWKDHAFVLTERYTSGARLEERYALDAHGALVYTRSLRDPTIGRIEIRSVYRRIG